MAKPQPTAAAWRLDLLPSPRSYFAAFWDAKPGGGFGPRYARDFQVHFVQSGSGHVDIDTHRYSMEAGDVIFYRPNERHRISSSVERPLRLIGLHFLFREEDLRLTAPGVPRLAESRFTFARGAPVCPLAPPPPTKASPGLVSSFRRHCESLVLSHMADPEGRLFEKRGLLLLLLQAWQDALLSGGKTSDTSALHRHLVEDAEHHVLTRLREPPTMEALARKAGVSPDHFDDFFRRIRGVSFRRYVLRQRLLEARRLLIEGRLNVSEAADAVGFADPLYFSRVFRRHFGNAPSQFRHKQRWK